MAKQYAIPAEVVFTFDDEPVDIQAMIDDNAESPEVVEGLVKLLEAAAAPGFTEAEVVFDIGGGVSVVQALSAKHYPKLVEAIRHRQARNAYDDARIAYQRKSGDTYYRDWTTSDTKEAKAMRAAWAVLEKYETAARRFRTGNPRKSVTNEEAAHLFGVSPDALGDTVKVGQTVTIETRYPNHAKNYTRKVTKVTKRYIQVTDGARYRRDTLEEDTSGSTWGIPGSAIVKIGGVRVDNPGDDGQQSLPLDTGRTGRTGNPAANPMLQTIRRYFPHAASRRTDSDGSRRTAYSFAIGPSRGEPGYAEHHRSVWVEPGGFTVRVRVYRFADPRRDNTLDLHILESERVIDADDLEATLQAIRDEHAGAPTTAREGNPKVKTLLLKDGSDKQPLLPGTDFRRLKIPRGSSFNDLDLRGAIFDGLDLSGVKPNIPVHKQRTYFAFADLRGASFRDADLRNASFLNAVVDADTDFTGALVDGADFAGALGAVLSPQQLAVVLRRPDYTMERIGNPHGGGGLVGGYGINTFAIDPDDYTPERLSNPAQSIATMLGRYNR